MLQRLKDHYENYDRDIRQAKAKASAFAGLFSMGDDPRNHPCHMRFYEDVEQWVQDFLKTGPDREAVYEAARWIITSAAVHRGGPTYWFEYAAHGLCGDLIVRLDGTECAELLAFYDEHYPKKDRLPVHKEVYKLLKKGAQKH